MSDFTRLQAELAALFEAHGLTPELRGDWLLVDGLYPAIHARVDGLLYIELAFAEGRPLTELYSADSGLKLFHDGAFPILLSAFWNRHNPGLVTRQIIKRADGPWQVFVGPYLRQVETGERPPLPYLLFETMEAFLREQPLEGNMHWLSTGVSVDEDGPAVDIRLDGTRLPALERRICALDWLYDGRSYRLRNATLLIRV